VKFNLRTKFICIILLTSFFCSIFIGIWGFYSEKQQQERAIGKKLLVIAKTAVLGMYYQFSEEKRSDVLHNGIKKYLVEIKTQVDIDQPLYLFEKKDKNHATALVSTEGGNSIGAEYRMNDTLKEVFSTGQAVYSKIYKDKSGTWISAYAPMKDYDDKVVYVLEVNSEISYYIELIKEKSFQITLSIFIAYPQNLSSPKSCIPFTKIINSFILYSNSKFNILNSKFKTLLKPSPLPPHSFPMKIF
jgi:methyl-accepting chemotaxis protein